MLAPDVFPIEVAHALTRAERQGRVSSADGWPFWQIIMANAPVYHSCSPLMARAYALSSTYRIGVYDCLYLALAEREAATLITADLRLLKTPGFPMIDLAAY